jgi:hypothetical protein
MPNGIMGFKVCEDDAKDQFALVNMRKRCTTPFDKMKPYMVLNDFRQTQFSWVMPWSFDKMGDPTRAIIVSRAQGIKID